MFKTFKNFMYLEILKGTGPKQLIAGDTFETHFSTKVYHKNDTWAGIGLEIEFLPKLNPLSPTNPKRLGQCLSYCEGSCSSPLTAASLSHTAAAHRQNVPSHINNAEA
jgi:hypothetical protein